MGVLVVKAWPDHVRTPGCVHHSKRSAGQLGKKRCPVLLNASGNAAGSRTHATVGILVQFQKAHLSQASAGLMCRSIPDKHHGSYLLCVTDRSSYPSHTTHLAQATACSGHPPLAHLPELTLMLQSVIHGCARARELPRQLACCFGVHILQTALDGSCVGARLLQAAAVLSPDLSCAADTFRGLRGMPSADKVGHPLLALTWS